MADGRHLAASRGALTAAYDLAMLDLDGVVYIGGQAVPGAADRLAEARRAGMQLAFVTNNASRPPGDVAARAPHAGLSDAARLGVGHAVAARVGRHR